MSGYDSYGDGGGGPQLALPRVTPVVRRLLIAILVAFILQYFISWRPEGQRWILFGLGLAPETWRAFFPFVPIWQLGSYGFLHGGLGHMLPWQEVWATHSQRGTERGAPGVCGRC